MKKNNSNKRMNNSFKEVRFIDTIKQTNSNNNNKNNNNNNNNEVKKKPNDEQDDEKVSHYYIIIIFIVLLLWNIYIINSLIKQLLTNEWKYIMYFDDSYNFIESKDVFSFHPFTWKQLYRLLTFIGINVYEPIGSLFKAFIFDLCGNESIYFRLWSLLIHFINGILLCIWNIIILQKVIISCNNNNKKKNKQQRLSYYIIIIVSITVTSMYLIHPLNVEVIAWASAQSYTIALTFYLLANIIFEYVLNQIVVVKESNNNSSFNVNVCFGVIYVLYVLACLSKAPAITLPAVHFLRVLLLPIDTYGSKVFHNPPEHLINKKLRYYFGIFAVVVAATCRLIVVANARGTRNAVVNYSQLDSKIIRAIITSWQFFVRVLYPSDLRVHYVLPPEKELSFLSLMNGGNDSYLLSTMLAIIFTIVLTLYTKKYPLLVFSWFSFLVAWTPGMGLINHGWSTFGADRYCYIPLAMLLPGACEVFYSIFLSQTLLHIDENIAENEREDEKKMKLIGSNVKRHELKERHSSGKD